MDWSWHINPEPRIHLLVVKHSVIRCSWNYQFDKLSLHQIDQVWHPPYSESNVWLGGTKPEKRKPVPTNYGRQRDQVTFYRTIKAVNTTLWNKGLETVVLVAWGIPYFKQCEVKLLGAPLAWIKYPHQWAHMPAMGMLQRVAGVQMQILGPHRCKTKLPSNLR